MFDKIIGFVCTTAITEDTVCVGLARVGADDQAIRVGSLREMAESDLGAPLHSMIITGLLHPLEVDMLKLFSSSDGLSGLKMTDSSTYVSWETVQNIQSPAGSRLELQENHTNDVFFA